MSALFFIALMTISSCTSHKKKGELSGFGQFYQNNTAYYNGYFNANLLYEEAIIAIEDGYQDDFNSVLAIFPYRDAPDVKPHYAELDLASEKVSKVVALKRPSHWTDDCYLMLAKCQYVKKDYESAEKTFQYLLHHFEPSKLDEPVAASDNKSRTATQRESQLDRKRTQKQIQRERRKARREAERERKKAQRDRRKGRTPSRSAPEEKSETDESKLAATEEQEETSEEESPTTGLFGHEPAYNEALIWAAKNYIERDQYSRASTMLQEAHSNSLSDDLKSMAYLVEAHLQISRSEYANAINPLESAIPLLSDKQDRARYSFILGQLYQRQGNFRLASGHFENAGKWTNDFELEFNADLQESLSSQTSMAGSLRELERLAKDQKNQDYRDRIYFTIGQLYHQQGNDTEALEALEKALSYQSGNENQIREIYYLKANLHLKKQEYVVAGEYFGQTLGVMQESDDRHKEVSRLASSLSEIGGHYDDLRHNDTLLHIATLSEEKQRQWAERQFAKDRKTQEGTGPAGGPLAFEKEGESRSQRQQMGLGRGIEGGMGQTRGGATRELESSFFAYDDRQVKRGIREFNQRWGDRELVDDWRRSNSRFYLSEIGGISEEDIEAPSRIVPESKIEEYLAMLPQSDAEVQRVKQGVIDALFHLGVLFREKMQDFRVSANHLERLTSDFRNSSRDLEGLYYLYLDYRDLGMEQEMAQVEERIISSYPNSKYAQVLRDPDGAKALLEEENRLPNYYRTIVEHFESGDYEEVQKRIARSKELFGTDHNFSPRIALINAMSMGNILGIDAYISELQEMIAQYPGTPEETRAKEILRFLQGDDGAFERYDGGVDIDKFTPEDDKMHYVIVVLHNSKQVSLNDAQISISKFNQKYYQLAGLRISNHFLDAEAGIPLILIRSFTNKTQAMRYRVDAASLAEEFLSEDADFEIYPITQRNYREVLRDRTTKNYKAFFEKHYQ